MESGQARFSVLFEDVHLLAVDKPAGIHSAPLRPGESGTLLGAVLACYPEVAGLPGIKSVEPGLLHRLDLETSGILLVARTPEAFRRLRAAFAAGLVRKVYTALCACPPDLRAGRLLSAESRFAPYGRGRKRVRAIAAGDEGRRRGESARRQASAELYRTEAHVLERRSGWALVEAATCKGFRHQVRAHLALLGLPIAGDGLYGVPAPAGAPDRLYLHATVIELAHPISGEPLRLRSPLPAEFRLPPVGRRNSASQ
jgi:23S rRNA pseudouridine1911/1915/1917 synthase